MADLSDATIECEGPHAFTIKVPSTGGSHFLHLHEGSWLLDGRGLAYARVEKFEALRRPLVEDARRWCEKNGFEFRRWDGVFCYYRDPRRVGTPLEYGMESWVNK